MSTLKAFARRLMRKFTSTSRDVYGTTGPFDRGLYALRYQGLDLVDSTEFADFRLTCSSHLASELCGWTAEGRIFLPTGDVLITNREYNPILEDAEEATDCDRSRGECKDIDDVMVHGPSPERFDAREYHPSPNIVKSLEERASPDPDQAIKTGVLFLPSARIRSGEYDVKFPFQMKDDPCSRFRYRHLVEQYAKWLEEYNGKEVYNLMNWAEVACHLGKPVASMWFMDNPDTTFLPIGWAPGLHGRFPLFALRQAVNPPLNSCSVKGREVKYLGRY